MAQEALQGGGVPDHRGHRGRRLRPGGVHRGAAQHRGDRRPVREGGGRARHARARGARHGGRRRADAQGRRRRAAHDRRAGRVRRPRARQGDQHAGRGEDGGRAVLLGLLRGPHRHRHAAARLLRDPGAEGAVPGQDRHRGVERRLLPDRAGRGQRRHGRDHHRHALRGRQALPPRRHQAVHHQRRLRPALHGLRQDRPQALHRLPGGARLPRASPSAPRRRSWASRAPPPPR